MRYVILFFGGAMFLFWDGYYRNWETTRAIVDEVDRIVSYIF